MYIAVVIIGRYVYQRCKRTAVRVEIQPDPEIGLFSAFLLAMRVQSHLNKTLQAKLHYFTIE